MSLLDSMMERCTMMDKVSQSDGMGGFYYIWNEGAEFSATIVKNGDAETRVAEVNGAAESFTVIVNRGVTLEYHDVFKRVRDGSIFRVTGRTPDNEAPDVSTVQISKVQAERWSIPA